MKTTILFLFIFFASCTGSDNNTEVVTNSPTGVLEEVIDASHVLVSCPIGHNEEGDYQIIMPQSNIECEDATCICATCDNVIHQGVFCGFGD